MNIESALINFFESKNVKQLVTSDLLRKDNHFFTFSPLLDVIDFYKAANHFTEGYKVQRCFRNVFPSNLINPLSQPLQTLISYHNFQTIGNLEIINQFINNFLLKHKLQKSKIYLIIPDLDKLDTLLDFCSNNQLIRIPKQRLYCNIPLEGEHYYVKLAYHYNNGLVTIDNFVLVNYKKNNTFQIDSVIFPQRITTETLH